MTTTRRVAGAMTLLLAVATLAGCATPSEPEPSATPTPTAEPSPSSTAEPEEPDDTLFTVSAKVRAIDGTTLDISLTGHVPLEADSSEASDLVSDFLDQCSAMDGRSVSDATTPVSEETLARFGSTLMRIDIAATPEGHTFFAPVDLNLGSQYFAEVASGDAVIPVSSNDTCTGSYQLTGSGTGTAIANYESGNENPDAGQWRFGHYGFSVPFESGATIEACRPVVTKLALSTLDDVPGWEVDSDSTGISCGIGYVGE